MKTQKMLVLASASPRRRTMLEGQGLSFKTIIADIIEEPKNGERPEDYVLRNACEKAQAVALKLEKTDDAVILSADTVVVDENNRILEKPLDSKHAFEMLKSLSGSQHTVLTAFAIFDSKDSVFREAQTISTNVTFRHISDEEINAYIKTGEPFDKAGSYGIQGQAASFVQSIAGSYTNIVGLPLCEVVEALKKFAGVSLFTS